MSSFSACGDGNSEAPQAVGSVGDRVVSSPTPVVEQQPEPEPALPQCKPDNPAGSEIVLLAGQSNANTGLLAALDTTLGHYYAGGNPIFSWILEDGTPGF